MASIQELGDLLDRKLEPIERVLSASRERERETRAKVNAAVRKLDALADAVKDDATKGQVRKVREDIAALAADDAEQG